MLMQLVHGVRSLLLQYSSAASSTHTVCISRSKKTSQQFWEHNYGVIRKTITAFLDNMAVIHTMNSNNLDPCISFIVLPSLKVHTALWQSVSIYLVLVLGTKTSNYLECVMQQQMLRHATICQPSYPHTHRHLPIFHSNPITVHLLVSQKLEYTCVNSKIGLNFGTQQG